MYNLVHVTCLVWTTLRMPTLMKILQMRSCLKYLLLIKLQAKIDTKQTCDLHSGDVTRKNSSSSGHQTSYRRLVFMGDLFLVVRDAQHYNGDHVTWRSRLQKSCHRAANKRSGINREQQSNQRPCKPCLVRVSECTENQREATRMRLSPLCAVICLTIVPYAERPRSAFQTSAAWLNSRDTLLRQNTLLDTPARRWHAAACVHTQFAWKLR